MLVVLVGFYWLLFSLPRQRKHERKRAVASNRRNKVPPIMSARSVGVMFTGSPKCESASAWRVRSV